MGIEIKLVGSKEELKDMQTLVISSTEDGLLARGWPSEEGTYRFMQYYLPAVNKTFLIFGIANLDSHADIAQRFLDFCGFEQYVQAVDMVTQGSRYKLNIVHPKKKSDARLVGAGFCDAQKCRATFLAS